MCMETQTITTQHKEQLIWCRTRCSRRQHSIQNVTRCYHLMLSSCGRQYDCVLIQYQSPDELIHSNYCRLYGNTYWLSRTNDKAELLLYTRCTWKRQNKEIVRGTVQISFVSSSTIIELKAIEHIIATSMVIHIYREGQ